jgi:hypothetical protein
MGWDTKKRKEIRKKRKREINKRKRKTREHNVDKIFIKT